MGVSDMDSTLDVIGKEFTRRVQRAKDLAEAGGAILGPGGAPTTGGGEGGRAAADGRAKAELATKLLVWYATSAAAPGVSMPVARYAMASSGSTWIYNTWIDVSSALARGGFDIAALVVDGASENRT
jgi:hypothetical protein